MRKIMVIGGVAAAAAGIMLGVAGTASAAQPQAYVFSSTYTYNAPSKEANEVGFHSKGDSLMVLCSVKGQNVDGNDDWLRVRDEGSTAFVHGGSVTLRGNVESC